MNASLYVSWPQTPLVEGAYEVESIMVRTGEVKDDPVVLPRWTLRLRDMTEDSLRERERAVIKALERGELPWEHERGWVYETP